MITIKFIVPGFVFGVLGSLLVWLTDFEEARAIANKENKLILINFSGSDWCAPCIRLEKEIFETDSFLSYARELLVLVKADFPRLKKNKLEKKQEERNNALAEQYNPRGKFPYTVLLDSNGKVLKNWDGFPAGSLQDFINDLRSVSEKSPGLN
jgi:thioredoxin-related protein